MHGIVKPESSEDAALDEGPRQKLAFLVRRYRWFLALVVLPTVIVAAYLLLFASDQYEARADFVVRQAGANTNTTGMGQFLGMDFGASATTSEAYLISDYMRSHESVSHLRKEDNLVGMFRREGVDWISRLSYADPTPEQLLKFFRGKVDINQDTETGITHLQVKAFHPDDAYIIARKLLLLGEERINQLNERTYGDQVSSARRELSEAEQALAGAERLMTSFRKRADDIDPQGTGSAQIGLVTNLTQQLTLARAKLQAMNGVISPSSPQYRAMQGQVQSLEAQIARQSSKLAGSNSSIAGNLGDYENLVVRREAAARRYSTAVAAFETAKAEAERQQVYLVRVVDVNRPVKALYPERGKIILTVFIGLTFLFAIVSMVVVGLREHHI